MKDEIAIIEQASVLAHVRARYSAYREAEVQVAKANKRAEDAERIAGNARAAALSLRLDVGRALLEAHKFLKVKKGDRSGKWAAFLTAEGIAEESARRWMSEAEIHDGPTLELEDGTASAPPPPRSEVGGSDIAPARRPLGLLADMQLYLGRWQDILSDAGVVDALISDPPFSKRTHEASRKFGRARADGHDLEGLGPEFTAWDRDDVFSFVRHWSPRTRGWIACMTDHVLIPDWEDAFEDVGRYSFAPVPCVMSGMSVRLRGDGPSSWSVFLVVARPKGGVFEKWGTLPGAYMGAPSRDAEGGRGKPRWLTDAIVNDYTRENDLVCDPLAGFGGTLISAIRLRRRAVGAEVDETAVNEAFARANALNEETENAA